MRVLSRYIQVVSATVLISQNTSLGVQNPTLSWAIVDQQPNQFLPELLYRSLFLWKESS